MIAPDFLHLLYAATCLCVIGFQISLIAGAPWGRITQGGTHPGALPLSGRLTAFASIFVLAGMAGGVASAAGAWLHWPAWSGRLALAVQGTSAMLNWITPSRAARRLWGPITTAMFLLAGLVVFTL